MRLTGSLNARVAIRAVLLGLTLWIGWQVSSRASRESAHQYELGAACQAR